MHIERNSVLFIFNNTKDNSILSFINTNKKTTLNFVDSKLFFYKCILLLIYLV